MNLGEAAQSLASLLGLGAATSGTKLGDRTRAALITAINKESMTAYEWNTASVVTAVNSTENDIALPSGTLAPLKLFYSLSATAAIELERVSLAEMMRLELTGTATGDAQYWVLRDHLLHWWRVPQVDWELRGIYLLDQRLAQPTYSGSTPTFPLDSVTTPWLEQGLDLTIALAATQLCKTVLNRPDRANQYDSEVQAHRATALDFAEKTIHAERVAPCL